MDFNTFIGILAFAATGYTAYLTRQQVQMLKTSTVSRRASKDTPTQPWWMTPTLLAVAFLALLTWVPWVYGLWYPTTLGSGRVEYGSLNDGRLYIARDIPEDKPDRNIIAVAFHYYGKVDINDQVGLQKSKPFDYRKGTQFITIEPDSIFFDEVSHGASGTNFMLLDVPHGITEDQFSTLRQAYKIGAKLMFSASKRP